VAVAGIVYGRGQGLKLRAPVDQHRAQHHLHEPNTTRVTVVVTVGDQCRQDGLVP
jgi:hypothetical protein